LNVSDEQCGARKVPNEAFYLVLVFYLLDHAPHASVIEVDLLKVIVCCENVLSSHGLPGAEDATDDFLFSALYVHWLSRLAMVPDTERFVLRG